MLEETAWQGAIELVEAWFESQGISPSDVRFDTPDSLGDQMAVWGMQHGEIDVYVQLQREEDIAIVQVYAPMATPDANADASFWKGLLQWNVAELVGCAFGVDEDGDVIITADRPTNNIRPAELGGMVAAVAGYANEFAPAFAPSQDAGPGA